jgi:hypothetical protein
LVALGTIHPPVSCLFLNTLSSSKATSIDI